MSTLAQDINNPDKPSANPDPHPLTPIPVPPNAVICPTCRNPITDGPYKIDEVGVRYHDKCGVAPSKGKKDGDGPRGVHATQLPFQATEDVYQKQAKVIEDQRKEAEERDKKREDDIKDARKREDDRPRHNPASSSATKVTGPPEPAHR